MLPDLLDFQRDFAAALDRPASGAMAVYRNTVLHGAVEALRANFPVVERILGPEMFEQVAVDHAVQRPPRRPVLALYGRGFADWLEDQPWALDLPYLADVARVERLRVECLMAADAEPLSTKQIAGNRTERGTLGLHPAARFCWLSSPAMRIWIAHQQADLAELDLEWKAEGALFARPSPFVLHAEPIGRAAHRILFGVRLGESLDDSMGAAARLYPAEDTDSVLQSLINLGAFAAPHSQRSGL